MKEFRGAIDLSRMDIISLLMHELWLEHENNLNTSAQYTHYSKLSGSKLVAHLMHKTDIVDGLYIMAVEREEEVFRFSDDADGNYICMCCGHYFPKSYSQFNDMMEHSDDHDDFLTTSPEYAPADIFIKVRNPCLLDTHFTEAVENYYSILLTSSKENKVFLRDLNVDDEDDEETFWGYPQEKKQPNKLWCPQARI